MPSPSSITAHIIVGSRQEFYLGSVLDAIAHICDHAVINDNSGMTHSPNNSVIENSSIARQRRVTMFRTNFCDFATARNACIAGTPDRFRDGWALFVDADEVHGRELAEMARFLSRLPDTVDRVDGYSRHFVGSFRWWRSVERRLCFFKLKGRHWKGTVHEKLTPPGTHIVLPVVWHHYGHVVTPRMEAEKGLLYHSLGQFGAVASSAELDMLDAGRVWGKLLRDALPFHGRHPAAARSVIDTLSQMWSANFADVDRIVAQQSVADRARNALRRANYSRVLASRVLEANLRWGWSLKRPKHARSDERLAANK